MDLVNPSNSISRPPCTWFVSRMVREVGIPETPIHVFDYPRDDLFLADPP